MCHCSGVVRHRRLYSGLAVVLCAGKVRVEQRVGLTQSGSRVRSSSSGLSSNAKVMAIHVSDSHVRHNGCTQIRRYKKMVQNSVMTRDNARIFQIDSMHTYYTLAPTDIRTLG